MISTKDMIELENNCGIPKLTLMENAGKGIFDILKNEAKGKRVLIVCHHGNNGGDGFVAARYLKDIAEVDVLFIGDETKFKEEAKSNFSKIDKDYSIQIISDHEMIDFDDYDIILDAILGTGANGRLKEPIGAVVEMINKSKAMKIAVDMPTGLDPDTGLIEDKAVDADMIITFHDAKDGLKDYMDKVKIVDIGIR